MGLMDKFKNLFTDEEVTDEEENETIEIKEIKKEDEEHKLPTFMREKIEREKQEQEEKLVKKIEVKQEEAPEIRELKVENIEEQPLIQREGKEIEEKQSFKFPIDLNDNDFIETRSRQAIHKERNNEVPHPKTKLEPAKPKEPTIKKEVKVADLYKDKKEEKKEERHFKATPIISPIYGILDQNYTSSEVENTKGNNLEHQRHSKNVDFDSVRKKAYGSLTEEIKENLMCENCEYLKEAKECKRLKEEEECLTEESKEELDYFKEEPTPRDYSNITLDEATENYYDYGVEYDKSNYQSQKENNIKIVNHDTETGHYKKEIPPVKSSINLLSTLKKGMGDEKIDSTPVQQTPSSKEEKNLELTDDLFNLIDSMYDERKDAND